MAQGTNNQEIRENERPIILKTMGSMAFGGKLTVKEDGETFHGDHGYAQYFVPQDATNYPIIFWHGQGQSGMCWESTADGRDGFWQIFSRRNVPVYIIDQPRRGRAGWTDVPMDRSAYYPILEHEGAMWTTYRNGVWAPPEPLTVFPGSQVPMTPAAVDQFFRHQCPDTADEPLDLGHTLFMADTMRDLLKQAGPSVLFTHSQSGKYGWSSAATSPDLIRAVFTYEPGHYLFPDDFELEYVESPLGQYINDIMAQYTIEKDKWMNLTKMPIRIYYGDYLPDGPSDVFGNEVWRFSTYRAKQFVDLINANGGDAKLTFLPDLGITGNAHCAFNELNNVDFANVVEKDLRETGLLASDKPYQGPVRKTLSEYNVPVKL